MHIDENKKFDKRNIEKNLKGGIITEKDYEMFLTKLPDVSDKLFSPESATDSGEPESREISSNKKIIKKKIKGKSK